MKVKNDEFEIANLRQFCHSERSTTRNAVKELVLLRTVMEKWRERVYKLYCSVTVIKRKFRMFSFTNLSNIFSQKHFRVTAVVPLKQLYQPLILRV